MLKSSSSAAKKRVSKSAERRGLYAHLAEVRRDLGRVFLATHRLHLACFIEPAEARERFRKSVISPGKGTAVEGTQVVQPYGLSRVLYAFWTFQTLPRLLPIFWPLAIVSMPLCIQ